MSHPPRGPEPPDGPPPSGGGSRALPFLLSVGAAALLTLALLVVSVAFGGDGDEPQDAVRDFFNALRAGDPEGAREVLCAAMRDSAELDADSSDDGLRELRDDFGNISWSVTDTAEDGDTATVFIEWTYTDPESGASNSGSDTIPVVEEDGDWKVCPSAGAGVTAVE